MQQGAVNVTLNSSGGFEIWGALGFSLPTSNEQINAQPGDVILYNGSNTCIFYGTNFMNLCHAPLTNWGLKLVDIQDGWTMLDNAGFTQTEIHRMKPSNATIIGVKA